MEGAVLIQVDVELDSGGGGLEGKMWMHGRMHGRFEDLVVDGKYARWVRTCILIPFPVFSSFIPSPLTSALISK